MELGILYVLPVIMVGIVCLWWFVADRRTGGQAEDELSRAEDRIGEAADRIADGTEAVRESEALADRAEEAQRGLEDNYRRIEEKAESVSELTKSSRTRAERISDLADECFEILEAAKKTKE